MHREGCEVEVKGYGHGQRCTGMVLPCVRAALAAPGRYLLAPTGRLGRFSGAAGTRFNGTRASTQPDAAVGARGPLVGPTLLHLAPLLHAPQVGQHAGQLSPGNAPLDNLLTATGGGWEMGGWGRGANRRC